MGIGNNLHHDMHVPIYVAEEKDLLSGTCPKRLRAGCRRVANMAHIDPSDAVTYDIEVCDRDYRKCPLNGGEE